MELDEINPEDWWPDAERRLDRFFLWKKLRLRLLGLGGLAGTVLVYWLSGSSSLPGPVGLPLPEPVAVLEQAPVAQMEPSVSTAAQAHGLETSVSPNPNVPSISQHASSASNPSEGTLKQPLSKSKIRQNNPERLVSNRAQETRSRNLEFRAKPTAVQSVTPSQRARISVSKVKPAETKALQTSPILLNQALNVASPFGSVPAAERNPAAFFRMQSMGYILTEGYVSDEQPIGISSSSSMDYSYVDSKSSLSKWKRYLSIQGGAMFITKTLSSTSSEYAARRKSEERKVWKPVAAVNVTFKRGNWGISTGIDYAEYGERTTYQPWKYGFERYEEHQWNRSTIAQTQTIITYYQGNPYNQIVTHYLKDSSLVINQNVRQTKLLDSTMVQNWQQTQFAYVEIPLMVDYGFTFGKWEAGLQAGGAFGWNTKREGRYLNTSQTGLEDISRVDYITPWNLSGRAGFRFGYALTPSMSITLNPQWRTQFISVTGSGQGINQRYSSWGVMAGLRFNW